MAQEGAGDKPEVPPTDSDPGLAVTQGPFVIPTGAPSFHPGEMDPGEKVTYNPKVRGRRSTPDQISASGDAHEDAQKASEAMGFRLLRIIGRGGMGEVWEAIQQRLWRKVALKRLRQDNEAPSQDMAESLVHVFRGEAMVSALLDHPNIVPIYDMMIDATGAPMIAMKQVEGENWDTLLGLDFKVLSVEEHLGRHLPVFAQVCQAVAFAHSKGIIHRDLKPSQVMVGDFGEVLLMDWGLAMMIGEPPKYQQGDPTPSFYPGAGQYHPPAGTPCYMAPEQTVFSTDELGPWTDVYLLGGVLYNILTGANPHPGGNSREAFSNASKGLVVPFEESAPGRVIPPELAELAMRALHRDRDQRPTTAEFTRAIQGYLTGSSRRIESQGIIDTVRFEPVPETYAGFTSMLGRVARAAALWPGNPHCPPMREELLTAFADKAFEQGDLVLARSQAEALIDGARRDEVLERIEREERRAGAQKRMLRAFATAVYALLTVVILGGLFFTSRLRQASEQTEAQLRETQAARDAEASARVVANRQSERAALLLANALVSQDRREEAVRELFRIPEERRYWGWGFVMTRALQDLWTSPWEYLSWSPSQRLAVAYLEGEGLGVLQSESAWPLARVPAASLEGLVAAFSRDEGRVAVAARGEPLRVLEAAGWTEVAELPVSGFGEVSAVEFSPDGAAVALGFESGRVATVELAGGALTEWPAHPRRIDAVYWGETKFASLSSAAVWRHEVATGKSLLAFQSGAIVGLHRRLIHAADIHRRHFAFAYTWSRAHLGAIDGDSTIVLPWSTESLAFAHTRPWLVVGCGAAAPQLAVHHAETGEWVQRRQLHLEEVAGAPHELAGFGAAGGVQISLDDSTFMHNDGSRMRVRLFPSGDPIGFPDYFDHGDSRALRLSPAGGAVWMARPDGTTRLRPLGQTFVGQKLPGDVPSISADGSYTSAIRLDRFEQRDVASGNIIFTGGRHYTLYQGSRTTADGKLIFLPGRRGDVFTVEKSSRESGALLGRYEWREPIALFALDADSAILTLTADHLTTRSVFSLEGPTAGLLHTAEAPPGGVFTGDILINGGAAIVQSTDLGLMIATDARSGEELARVQAHDGPFTNLALHAGTGTIMSTGVDRHVRLWEPATLALRAEFRFDFPVAGAVLSGDAGKLLAWPAVGSPVLIDAESQQVVCALDRTNFPMGTVRFIANDTRIFAQAGSAARFWDPETGQETFNVDSGFGTISGDHRKFVFKEQRYGGTLLEIAPTRADMVAGGSGLSFRNKLDLWMIGRHREWNLRQLRGRLPESLDTLAQLEGTIAGNPSHHALNAISEAYSGAELADGQLNRRVLRAIAELWMTWNAGGATTDELVFGSGVALQGLFAYPDIAHGPEGAVIVTMGARAGQIYEAWSLPHTDLWIVMAAAGPVEAMARVLEARGDRGRALDALRWASAVRQLSGLVPERPELTIARLGGTIPDPPPPQIMLGPVSSTPPIVLEALNAIPMDATEAERGALTSAAWESYGERRAQYLGATPAPDWAAIIAEEAARPEWQPLPEGLTYRDYADQLRRDAERIQFGGRSLGEALADEAARFDALFAGRLAELTAP